MEMQQFFESLIGHNIWFCHGDIVRLQVLRYNPNLNEVICQATHKDGISTRGYFRADYLYDLLKDRKLKFLW